MTSTNLLSPTKVGDHMLDHRVVLASMTRLRNTEDGVPQAHCVEYYRQRTTKNGLLITEGTLISSSTFGLKYAPGIFTDDQIEGWKNVVDGVHAKGGIIFIQIAHLGRAACSKLLPGGHIPVSASAIAIQGKNMLGDDHDIPHALNVDEIKATIHEFVNAAKNAMEAGFDGIELHGANGFLIDQFINTSSNFRTDAYGGSIENRARYALEVVDAVVEAVGAKRVSIRLSPWSDYQDMKDDTPIETWSYITQQLQIKHPNLAYIHYIGPREVAQLVEESKHIETLDPFREIWKGPFITNGGFLDPKKAIQHCEEYPNSLIAFGRIFLANPDLVERIRQNLPLNKYHPSTFYTQGIEGYTDYPFYSFSKEQPEN